MTRLLLGVCGSVAASATPLLVRTLRRRQLADEVRLVATESALRILSERELRQALPDVELLTGWGAAADSGAPHVRLATWAELVMIAPATAGTLAKLAHGLADDLLPAIVLATAAPVVVAPAMSETMWRKPATRRNLRQLAEDGFEIVAPRSGRSLTTGRVEDGSMGDVIEALTSRADRRAPFPPLETT